ncbi:ABC transporter permease [Rhizomonospora bruguierae]|uniref:ABC transporter permease n=1 Tax=Rhizomonospora bruguierae TaxID=1581705 RepID=UPI001BCC64FC|nr:ABC transporter permease [Micromonospora sp. NBRC 107566]
MTTAVLAEPRTRLSPTLAHILRRIGSAVLTLLVVLGVVFLVFQVLGDPARRTLPINASEEQVASYRAAMGYDDPVLEQFWRFMRGAVLLDFGQSTTAGRPAIAVVMDALPNSLLLATTTFVITALVGIALGTWAGVRAGTTADRVLQAVGAFASSVPEFWSGLVLIIALAVTVPIFPTGGSGTAAALVLPSVAMAIPPIGRLVYVVRESVRSTMAEPFMLVARSKGLGSSYTLRAHLLRAAAVPIVSVGGLELTRLAIGGVVVIESVFAWPGIGRLYVQAMQRYDIALVSATLFVATAVVLALNTLLDILYMKLDPRIEVGTP